MSKVNHKCLSFQSQNPQAPLSEAHLKGALPK